jgi:hypothetical protein
VISYVVLMQLESHHPNRSIDWCFKIRHRLLTARGVTAISGALRHARGDGPEPAAILGRCVGPHDPADVPLAVERIVIIVRPRAAGAVR